MYYNYYCHSSTLRIATTLAITIALFVVSQGTGTAAFLTVSPVVSPPSTQTRKIISDVVTKAVSTSTDSKNNEWAKEDAPTTTAKNDDFHRSMRVKANAMRAEALALEHKMLENRLSKLREEFNMFDSDGNGIISYGEFKIGLEKVTKCKNIPKQTIQKLFIIVQQKQQDDHCVLVSDNDDSNNSNTNADNNNENNNRNCGGITFNEFVGVNELCNMLKGIENEERTFAKKEKEKVLELVKLTMERINEKDANIVDRVISIGMYHTLFLDLKYLFFDIGAYYYPIALHHGVGAGSAAAGGGLPLFETTISLISALLYQFSIPKLIISSNPGENQLLRFNCEQIIILGLVLLATNIVFASSIALVVPMISQGSSSLMSSNDSMSLLSQIIDMSSNGTFFAFVVCIGYSVISSFCGIIPNEIPIISNYVTENTVITTETFKLANAIEITSSSLEELKKTDPIKSTLLKHITNTISPLMDDNNCVYTRLPLNRNNHYHHHLDIGSIGNNINNNNDHEHDEGKIVIVKAIKNTR